MSSVDSMSDSSMLRKVDVVHSNTSASFTVNPSTRPGGDISRLGVVGVVASFWAEVELRKRAFNWR
jgi:hypothetical protein